MTLTEKIRFALANAYTYPQYREMLDSLMSEGKTTGNDHSEKMIAYAKLNIQRMNRWDKTIEISEKLQSAIKSIEIPQTWLVITEGWCGDAAQNIPLLYAASKLNEKITFRLILRDENLEIMDNYLTNGGRAIPKMIVMESENLQELGTWGARPQAAQDLVIAYKQNPNSRTYAEFTEELHSWYNKDKTFSLQNELVEFVKVWNAKLAMSENS